MNSKWQINRVGLLDFWYYDEEEFDFLTNIINSSLLGCEILNARENYLKNREYLLLMLESYFAKIEKKGKEASIEK